MGNELHEPYAVKAARPVLGRGRGGNTFSLFDFHIFLVASSFRAIQYRPVLLRYGVVTGGFAMPKKENECYFNGLCMRPTCLAAAIGVIRINRAGFSIRPGLSS